MKRYIGWLDADIEEDVEENHEPRWEYRGEIRDTSTTPFTVVGLPFFPTHDRDQARAKLNTMVNQMNRKERRIMTHVIFTQPHLVNAELAARCGEGVVVLDVAFNAGRHNPAKEFNETTKAFIDALGDRLVAWVDHHDHNHWSDYTDDPRFVLVPRAQAPACPPILTPELVRRFGPDVDTIVCHGDFDGVISAVTWLFGGFEPYDGSLADSVAADTRVGEMSSMGILLESAMKANIQDDAIRQDIVSYLTYAGVDAEQRVKAAARNYEAKQRVTTALAEQYHVIGKVALVDATSAEAAEQFDRTTLLLAGQKLAQVAIVKYLSLHNGEELITVGAPRPWNFVEMLHLAGGMPNVVTVPSTRLDEVVNLINSK